LEYYFNRELKQGYNAIITINLLYNMIFWSRLAKTYQSIVAKEVDILNKARIIILTEGLLSFFLLGVIILLLNISLRHQFSFGVFNLLMLFAAGLALLTAGISWKLIGHFFILTVCYLMWSNLNYYNLYFLVAIQYLMIIVTYSYYILGDRWGIIYSVGNIVPFILVILIYLPNGTEPIPKLTSEIAFSTVLVFNFILVALVHYHFFKAFRQSSDAEKTLFSDLKRLLGKAEDIAVAKTNFLSTISHELRTPLNAIIGITGMIITEPVSENQKSNLEIVRFSAENLMGIVNDILDFNKIDTGEITLDPHEFKISLLLENIYDTFKKEAGNKNLAFHFSIDDALYNIEILGDPARLSRILFNLIGNAIKFTTKGHVKLSVKSILQDDGKITIGFIIEDTGIGIPLDEQPNLFDPYLTSNSATSRQFHGTGLGLIIAKKLIDLHNGQLVFISTEGIGSVFEFSIVYPFKTIANSVTKTIKYEDTLELKKKLRVLVAEDNSLNVLVLKKILSKWGIEAVVVENGAKAVEAVKHADFDVILMDINMPVMDGFEASKHIREMPDPYKANVCIIALTALSSSSIQQNAGFTYLNDFIVKPLKPEKLKEKLCQVAQKIENIG